jgi:hypothetical protein
VVPSVTTTTGPPANRRRPRPNERDALEPLALSLRAFA